MFVGQVNNWTSVVGTAVPFGTVLNSNNKISNTNGVISLNKSGYYDFDCSLTLFGVAGDIIVSLYADGSETTTFAEATTSSATDIVNVSLTDGIKCVLAQYPNVANISVMVDTAGVTVNGKARVQYVQ